MAAPERAWVTGLVHRARDDVAAPGLHQDAPIRLLLVGGPDHVDLALEPVKSAGEGQGAAPLAGPGLGREPGDALGLVVKSLRYGGVRLVRAGGRDRLVLEVDARRRAQGLFQPGGPDKRGGPPQAQDVEDLSGDLHRRLGRHLLGDQRHGEKGGQVVGPERLAGGRVQGRPDRLGQQRDDVEPGCGQFGIRQVPAHCLAFWHGLPFHGARLSGPAPHCCSPSKATSPLGRRRRAL